MLSNSQIHLTQVFVKIFLRDRQSIFFSLFFPFIFMSVFSFVNNGDQDPIAIGIVDNSGSEVAQQFIAAISDISVFETEVGDSETMRGLLLESEKTMLIELPQNFDADGNENQLNVVVDAAQIQQLSLIMPLLQQTLVTIERQFRNTEPMFSIALEDVKARSKSYLDFLLPGLLAFTLMQLSVAGSGFNIVEYRRKGILKRLFVTPIQPKDFITAIVLARMSIVVFQLTLLLAFAVFILDVNLSGNIVSLYLIILVGTFIFLCLGFCLGSIAKTQQAVMAVGNIFIFPQIFLSGVFYPIESMPEFVQPIAHVLPLSFVSTALRDIANDGLPLLAVGGDLIGIAVWLVIAFVLSTRLFVWKEVAA